MYKACRHIKPNGLRCESRVLRGGNFCYFHSKLHNTATDSEAGKLKLPIPEGLASIPISVARISDALIAGRIDVKQSAQLFWGLQIAFRAIERSDYFPYSVWSVTQTEEGDELAPEVTLCIPGSECYSCQHRTTCSDSKWSPPDPWDPDYVEPDSDKDENDGADEDENDEDNDGADEDSDADGDDEEDDVDEAAGSGNASQSAEAASDAGDNDSQEGSPAADDSTDVAESQDAAGDDGGDDTPDHAKQDDSDKGKDEDSGPRQEGNEGDDEESDADGLDPAEALIAARKSLDSIERSVGLGP